jgi:hypothetical protein
LYFCAFASLRLCVEYLLFPSGFNPGCRSRVLEGQNLMKNESTFSTRQN